ncbi:MAG: cupin domain-containing protein [Bacteroidales bacterium]|nr:cupin domain-containing protein [Bacteroidales bacterium]
MIVDFNSIEQVTLPNFKGGEKEYLVRMFANDNLRLMEGCLMPGASIGLHKHEGNCEIMFIQSGTGVAIINGMEEKVAPGICHYCPEGDTHTLINNGNEPLKFLAAVQNL